MPTKRNYKKEYKENQSSPARRKYRAELNKEARKRGIYGKRKAMGKDLVHKGGKIVGLGSASANKADGARKATRARMRKK
jgi:hypothetical protein